MKIRQPLRAAHDALRRAAPSVLLALALSGPAWAVDTEQRLNELAALSEKNNAKARAALLAEARELGETASYASRIRYLRLLRRVQNDAGDRRAAYEINERIMDLAQAERDQVNIALASLVRINRQLDENDPVAALALLETLGARYRNLGNLEFSASLEVVTGMAYNATGQFDKGLHHFLRGLEIVQRNPGLWSPREADIRLAVARLYDNSGDAEKALDTVRELRASVAVLPPRVVTHSHFLEGRALVSAGRVKEGLEAFDQALSLARASELRVLEAGIVGHIADAHLRVHHYEAAERAARLALPLAERIQDQTSVQMAKANLGFALFGQGRVREGLVHIDEVAQALAAKGAMAGVANVLSEKAQALEKAGMYREALATIREREDIQAQLASKDRNKAISALQEQFKAKERVAQIDRLRQENDLKDVEIRNRSLRQTVAWLAAALALVLSGFVFFLYQKSVRTGRRLSELNEELAYRSAHDPLTGLYNRRSFQERMRHRGDEEAARVEAADCFTLLDIDHFKRINDVHGHAAGDAVLVEVGRRLSQTVRESDMVLRWGGEEFLVYSQGVSPAQRPLLVQRILDTIAATPVVLEDGTSLQISATAGAVSLPLAAGPDEAVGWEQAIALADRALYKGKEGGRNRGYIVHGVERGGDDSLGALDLHLVLPAQAA
ncbi:tetratricopeptide repeat-containing diguanylate cyclase [Massilia sp. KIM]|uniref:tetratricopeptide repeat-containing diguanylate cyclase n=1 Tax=Massilia sp. KIM TaxID=1955422 RepID=UPI001E3ECB09|nr:tetratricopeptide repeat-containing diguanylate cyclase [Massilia sp. KIM]